MRKHSQIALIILGVVIFIILVIQTPIMSHLRSQFWRVWVKTIDQIFKIGPLTVDHNVKQQMERLVADNARLRAENIDYRKISTQINSTTFADYKSINARVMTRPIDTFHSQFILNRGAKHGLVLGAPVVIQGSILVGFITKLDQDTSILQLLAHPDTSLTAQIISVEDNTVVKGLVQGRSFTSVEIVTIPKDVSVSPGQLVTSASQNNLVPLGLLVGNISAIQDEEYEPYQKARLALPYDPSDLAAVTILVAP